MRRGLGIRRQRGAMDSMGGGDGASALQSLSSSEMGDDVARRLPVGEEGSELGVHQLGRASYLCDLRHDVDQTSVAVGSVVEPGVVSRWRMKDRVSVTDLLSWKSTSLSLVLFVRIVAQLGRIECVSGSRL